MQQTILFHQNGTGQQVYSLLLLVNHVRCSFQRIICTGRSFQKVIVRSFVFHQVLSMHLFVIGLELLLLKEMYVLTYYQTHTARSDPFLFHIYLLVRQISLKFQILWLKCGIISFLSHKPTKVISDFILNYLKKVAGGSTTQKYQKQMLKP